MSSLWWSLGVRFEQPAYLLLLLLVPVVIALSFRSLSGLGPGRRIVALIFRSAVIVVIACALAGLQRVKTTDDLSVAFLLDRSNSMPANHAGSALQFIKATEENMRPDDTLGIVGFSGKSAVLQLPEAGLRIQEVSDPLLADQTNLAAAARLALAMFDETAIRRLVLISDGNENAGEILQEASNFAAAGVPIDVLPVRYTYEREIVLESLRAPAIITGGEATVKQQVILRSTLNEPTSGTIKLYQGNRLVLSKEVRVPPGRSSHPLIVPLSEQAAYPFRAVFEPAERERDTIAANNEGRAFTIVSGPGEILLVTTPENRASSEFMAQQLAREKVDVRIVEAGAQPLTQAELLNVSLVILDNVPADLVPSNEQDALRRYVEDLGGGLVMVGGDESYSAGGWIDSPVEAVMPIEFDVKSKKQIPKGALVLIMHSCEIPQGNYIGERIAIAAVKTLSSRDLIGVLAWDWQGGDKNWTVPLQPAGAKTAAINAIKQMSMGDLPDLTPVVKQAVDALAVRSDAAARHILITSDFDPQFNVRGGEGGRLLQKMKDNNISCSTVSIGWGGHPIDAAKANAIAQGAAKGGKHYAVKDFSKLPQIFIKEARIVQRSTFYENEEGFVPRITPGAAKVLPGLQTTGVPRLNGYVVTTRKPLADVPLVRDTEEGQDPILAHWQAGLGRTVAFTSGMWPRWGQSWANWDRFGANWAQLIRWAARQGEGSDLDVQAVQDQGQGVIRIRGYDGNTQALRGATMGGEVYRPDGAAVPMTLERIGPGEWEGRFDTDLAGSYIANMMLRLADGSQIPVRSGLSVAYSPEYRELAANVPLLNEIAERTRGRVLTAEQARDVFNRAGLALAETRRPVWEDLIRLMLLLFLLDVAVRRIAITPADVVRRVRQFFRELAGGTPSAEASAATLGSLKGARDQAREALSKRQGEAGRPPDRSARYEPPASDERSREQLSQALGGASELDQPVVSRPTRKPQRVDEGQYTSRLLAAKKRAQQQREQSEQQDEPPADGS